MEYFVEKKTQEYWEKKRIIEIIIVAIECIMGFYKTIIFNLYYFGIYGLTFPIILSSKVKLKKLKGRIIIDGKYKFGMIKLGFPAIEMYDNSKLRFIWINDGIIVFKGNASMHNGTCIRNYGLLEIGKNFHTSATARIVCYKHIKFGDEVLIGWNFEITDGDAHKIYKLNNPIVRTNDDQEVIIGHHVWFGADVRVYKGITIPDNTVVAAGTKLFKCEIHNENCVIGDNPIRVLKENIIWKI